MPSSTEWDDLYEEMREDSTPALRQLLRMNLAGDLERQVAQQILAERAEAADCRAVTAELSRYDRD